MMMKPLALAIALAVSGMGNTLAQPAAMAAATAPVSDEDAAFRQLYQSEWA